EIKKCVAFLCVKDQKGHIVPGGTGFFVSIPSEKYPERGFTFFVTAKHNVIKIGEKDSWIRINNNEGKIINLEIKSKDVKWFYHPDYENNPADVAVAPFGIDLQLMNVKTIPVSMFLTSELIKNGEIGIGNEVFITGLFSRLSG